MASYADEIAPLAAVAAAQLGDSTSEILGQWNAEGGYGGEENIKNNPGNVETNGTVQSFPSMAQGVAAYVQTEQHYGTNDASNPSAFAQANAGYDPGNPNYPSLILGTIETPETQTEADSVSGSNAALLASVPTAQELTAAEKGKPVYNPSTMGGVSNQGSCSFLGWDYCTAFSDNWEYLVMILAIVLLVGAGIFGVMKTMTQNGDIPIPME